MYESRKSIRVWTWTFVLLLGLTVGMAHAHGGSIGGMNSDASNQPMTEDLAADRVSDSSVTADARTLEAAVEPDCASDTSVLEALGIETALSVNESAFSWVCGSCSISACAGRPVGSWCGSGRYCVVSTICPTQPLTDRCVCGTDHF